MTVASGVTAASQAQGAVRPGRPAPTGVRLLVASAGNRLRAGLAERLGRLGAAVSEATTPTELMAQLDGRAVDACLIDLSGEPGLPAFVRVLRARYPKLPVACVVDPVATVVAGEALQAGAWDVLPWPVEDRDLALLVANLSDARPGPASDLPDEHEPLFAQSPAMQEVLERAAALADGRGGVVLVGEPGTGRGLIARTLHRLAPGGAGRPFVQFDAADLSPQEIELRLFGVPLERRPDKANGAARVADDGALMQARGGMLYLTRATDLPARVQSALARLLRDREAPVAGRREAIELDVRPVAAVDPDVDQLASDGRLQADLLDRLSAGRIDLVPLRRRREDVPLLAAWLLARATRSAGGPPKAFSRAALALVAALPWHGNVAELRSLVTALVRGVRGPVVQVEDVLAHASLDGMSARLDIGGTLREAKARFERECISAVLRRHHGRVGEAAKALGIQRTNLYRKVRQLNVSRALLSSRR